MHAKALFMTLDEAFFFFFFFLFMALSDLFWSMFFACCMFLDLFCICIL